ncbi:MAG TPA: glycosyltransferase family 4 protein [Thermoanaerobaculia bacterium]|nr:glycosyltransferase family 4 protein [Thermoanaerobaculia bacterium]
MKILHLAAGNRWTGAAAPAFAEVAALRQAGVDAHYAYVGGYKLEAKIGRFDFTHPIIAKAQNPLSFASSSGAISRLIDHHGFDIVHAHLTYDHWLARFGSRGWRTRIARTFHSRRVIRSDPFTKSLLRNTDIVCVINDALRQRIGGREPVFTPPPLDDRQFRPYGDNVREHYGVTEDVLLIAAIGKLSRGRGFELVLQAFSEVRKRTEKTRLMIIGHGEHRPALESIARGLGIDADVIWAGYHEDDLAEHYRSADFLLFTAEGSDEGHRAVIEAMACGTVPITAPLAGMEAILGRELSASLIAAEVNAQNIAACLLGCIAALDVLRNNVVERSTEFAYPRAAQRLIGIYSEIL